MSNISIGQYRKFLELLEQKDVDSKRFQALLPFFGTLCDPSADLSNMDAFRAALKLFICLPEVFRFTVDYGKSLEQMIVIGRYDEKASDITAEHFPIDGNGVIEFEARYFYFERNIEFANAMGMIERRDGGLWSPAKIEHVLSHGAAFPEEQRRFPIVGPGSIARIEGKNMLPCLYGSPSKRLLGLRWREIGLAPVSFLSVRKISVPVS